MSTADVEAASPVVDSIDPRHRIVLRVLTAATFVVILNETIMVNAIPQLMSALGVSARAAQWLSTGFMLTMGVVIPATGWFLQRVGTRLAFATAMGLFCTGTLLAALSPTFPVLLGARAVQASGTAVMLPLLMSTLLALVPEAERGRMMGNVTLTISVAPALGPALSGLILSVASWRWLFGLVLPVALLAAVVGLRLLPNIDEPQPATLDGLSLVLTALGFGSLVYGLSQLGGEAASGGIGPAFLPQGALLVGAVGVGLFVWRQLRLQRDGTPLLDLRVLTRRGYTVALAVLSLSFMAVMGAVILLPMYLQQVRGMTALQAGLMLMPGGLAMGLLGPTVGRLYDRYGPRVLALPGGIVVVACLAALVWAVGSAPIWVFVALHTLVSVALAFVFTPLFTSGLASLPAGLYPHGSAMLGALQQIAAAAGTALVVTVMTARTAALTASGSAPLEALASGTAYGFGVAAALAVLEVGLLLLVPKKTS